MDGLQFFLIIICLWLFLSFFFSVISGWWSLSRKYLASERPEGERLQGHVMQVGVVHQALSTHMIVSRRGLYLYSSFIHRFMHPPLLIPWSKIRRPRKRTILWWTTYAYQLDFTSSVRVTERAHEIIERWRKR